MYQTDHSNTGPVHKKTRWRPFVRTPVFKCFGLSGIQMALKTQTIWHLASFQPFEHQTSSVFRSPLYMNTRLVQHWEYPLWIKFKFFGKCFLESVSGFRQICSHANWQQQPNQRRILLNTNKLDCFFEQKQIDGTNKTTNLNVCNIEQTLRTNRALVQMWKYFAFFVIKKI